MSSITIGSGLVALAAVAFDKCWALAGSRRAVPLVSAASQLVTFSAIPLLAGSVMFSLMRLLPACRAGYILGFTTLRGRETHPFVIAMGIG